MNKGIADRVLVIGIDGATFDLLDPWIEAGELPNIASLIHNGVRGRLSSVLPINSVAGWASFATGMNPGKHGLYDFKVRKEGSYETELVDINMLEKPTLWEVLSAYGKRVGVINVPICYPPQEVNGFMVSGMLTPNTKVTYTYPPDLAEEIEERVGGYQIDVDHPRFERGEIARKIFLKDIEQLTDIRRRTVLFLMREYPWDFLLVVFTGTDRMQHFFWGYNDPSHPLYHVEGAKELRARFKGFFRFVDRVIGEIVANAGEETVKFLVSDHGFGPLRKRFHLNRWLHELGVLTLREETPITFYEKVSTIIRKLDPRDIRRSLIPFEVRTKLVPQPKVDWALSKAYAAPDSACGVFINLRGREPNGTVDSPGEYEMLQHELAKALLQVRDPETREPIVERIFRASEICWGEKVEKLPDLLIQFSPRGYDIVESLSGPALFEEATRRSGVHTLQGVFIASGPSIIRGSDIERHNLMDVAPTILHLFDLPVPKEMDGRVMEEIFEERREVQLTETVVGKRKTRGDQQNYSLEEQKEIEERLRGLGYLS